MSAYSVRPKGSAASDFLAEHAQVLSILVFFAACVVLFSITTTTFLTIGNILNLLRQAAPVLVVAIAMTFVMTTGGIDLSVGSLLALTNALAALAIQAGVAWPVVVVLLLGLGGLIGLAQGWFVAYQAIPAFIVTLAGLSTLRGIALYLTQGYSIAIEGAPGFIEIGRGSLFGAPLPAVIAIAVALVGHVVLTQMKYGRQITAVGANAEAARRVGMPARWITASAYGLSGLAAAFAGIMIAARLGSGSSNAAVGFELDAIAAVVLGGTSLMGGRGTIIGSVLGTLTIASINNGLILLHVSPFLTQIVTGVIILAAIWLNTRIFSTRFRFRRRT